MNNKFPKIYKNKINNIKSEVQSNFYYHYDDKKSEKKDFKKNDLDKVDKMSLLTKINNIFSSPSYVYQADVIIMYKNGENKRKKIIGFKNSNLITIDNEIISIDDVIDIK